MKRFISFFLIISSFSTALGQKELTLEQAVLQQYTEFRPKTLTGFSWLPGKPEYSYVSNDSLVIVNVTNSKMNRALTLSDINDALKANNFQPLKGYHGMGDEHIRFKADKYFVLFIMRIKLFLQNFLLVDNSQNHEFTPMALDVVYLGQNVFLMSTQGNP
jgi:hypothetical protein